MWFYFALLSTLIGGNFSVTMKKVTQKNKPKDITIIGLLYFHIIALVISLIGSPNLIGQFSLDIMIDLLPLIFTQSISFFCIINSLKRCSVYTNAMITPLRAVIPIVLGVLILNEEFNIGLLLVSMIMIILSTLIRRIDIVDEEHRSTNFRGILYAYGFVIFNGIASFLGKIYVDKYKNPFLISYYFAIVIIVAIFTFCLITKKWNKINIFKVKDRRYFLLNSAIDSISTLFTRFSLINGPLSLTSLISSFSIVVGILGGVIFFKERISKMKILLCFLMTICIFLIAVMR